MKAGVWHSQRWPGNCDSRLTSRGKFTERGFWGSTAESANDERTEVRCVPVTRKTVYLNVWKKDERTGEIMKIMLMCVCVCVCVCVCLTVHSGLKTKENSENGNVSV